MSVDYDMVVLGGALEGRVAALTAASYGARVALVEPPGLFEDGQRQRWLLNGLQQLSQASRRQAVSEWFGYGAYKGDLDWARLVAWSGIAAEGRSAPYSAAVMSARGVDVVLERPVSLSRRMVVTTESRRLSARGVVVACGLVPAAMPLLEKPALPNAVDVVGGSALALTWAEALVAVGVRVRLIAAQVLPELDADVGRWARSRLIATGVELASGCEGGMTTLQIDPGEPALTLPAFAKGQSGRSPFLSVNRKLQTSHARLFACGSVLGGSTSERLAEYEAKLAVGNALFLPSRKVDYCGAVVGCGDYARAGLTQREAVRRYGEAVRVRAVSDSSSADLSRVDPMPMYCKVVFAGDRVVGIHFLGEGAEALASLLGKVNSSVASLAERKFCEHRLADLFFECVWQYSADVGERSRQSRWKAGQWRRDWAENWFNWRRSQN